MAKNATLEKLPQWENHWNCCYQMSDFKTKMHSTPPELDLRGPTSKGGKRWERGEEDGWPPFIFLNMSLTHLKCFATLPCETWRLNMLAIWTAYTITAAVLQFLWKYITSYTLKVLIYFSLVTSLKNYRTTKFCVRISDHKEKNSLQWTLADYTPEIWQCKWEIGNINFYKVV